MGVLDKSQEGNMFIKKKTFKNIKFVSSSSPNSVYLKAFKMVKNQLEIFQSQTKISKFW